MRKKQFLAAILLGAVLCFVSGAGYGSIEADLYEKVEVSYMEHLLLYRMVVIIMVNSTKFGDVRFYYDRDRSYGKRLKFPELYITS